jgi:hypothetical protein
MPGIAPPQEQREEERTVDNACGLLTFVAKLTLYFRSAARILHSKDNHAGTEWNFFGSGVESAAISSVVFSLAR